MSGKSLFDNAIAFSPLLAKVFGACGALLIQQIHYHCAGKTNAFEGHFWVYNTTEAWAERLMLWDERTIRRTLASLRSSGVVITTVNNKAGYDRTLWYRIGYDALCTRLSEALPMWSFCPNGSGQNVRIEAVKMSAPIPKKEAKNSTKSTATPSDQKPKTKPPTGEPVSPGEKDEIMLPKNGVKKGPSNVSAVLKKTLGGGSATDGIALYQIWASEVPKHHPEIKFIAPASVSAKSQFSRLAKDWGDERCDVMRCVIMQWVSFGKTLKDWSGIKTYPSVPTLSFLVTHREKAKNFFLQKGVKLTATPEATIGSKVVSGKIPQKVVPVVEAPEVSPPPVVEEAPITLEELLLIDLSSE